MDDFLITGAKVNVLREGWDLLVDWYNSPGGSDEAVRLFLARDVHLVPDDELHVRTEEELGIRRERPDRALHYNGATGPCLGLRGVALTTHCERSGARSKS